MTATWLRWMPAVAVPAVIAAGVLAGPLPASAGDPLPDKTPAQVLAMIAQHSHQVPLRDAGADVRAWPARRSQGWGRTGGPAANRWRSC